MITKLLFSGQPSWGQWDYTFYEDQVTKHCDGRPQGRFIPSRCGNRDKHPAHEFTGTAVVQVRRGDVVEADLDDGSVKAAAMKEFVERGFAHAVAAP